MTLDPAGFTIELANEQETAQLGADIAIILKVGDLICLSGDLGVGKTVLARSCIRYLANDEECEVPSPTYNLFHSYETELPIAHFDLYRLESPDELEELGWQEALDQGCALVEWPEQGFETLPEYAIQLSFIDVGGDARQVTFSGNDEFLGRITRSLEIRQFLKSVLPRVVTRSAMVADASARAYEVIASENDHFLLMNSPEMPDGPPIKDGKSYSKLAHLAESVTAFVAIDKVLLDAGFCAPEIPGFDLEKGLLLIEFLGDDGIIDDARKPIQDRYVASAEFLAELHQISFSGEVDVDGKTNYQIPPFDEQVILAETDLMLQWYVPYKLQSDISPAEAAEFVTLWQNLHKALQGHEHSIVLRDHHSPNIIWRGEKSGTDRVGVIDFQDALLGPSSYDVASLAQDARVDVSENLERIIYDAYIKHRKLLAAEFDEESFHASYAIMAAQRATKILGIFVRLNERDDKPQYLAHLPRIEAYLKRSLRHPILNEYRNWLGKNKIVTFS